MGGFVCRGDVGACHGEEGGCAVANWPVTIHGGWAICAQRQVHSRLCSVQGVPHEALCQEQGGRAQPLLVLHGSALSGEEGNGQIISVNQIYDKNPEVVKNFGFWFRYDTRTGTHNAYKEFRAMKLTDAVNMLYQDMAGRSRAKAAAIQILKTAEIEPKDCKRPIVKQFHSSTIKFPLPHRVVKTPKEFKTTFKASRPNTYF